MVVLVVANAILTPVQIAYFADIENEAIEWTSFNLISDAIFIVDIIFNFRTGRCLVFGDLTMKRPCTNVKLGSPHGTVHGLSLFICFNNLTQQIASSFRLFAGEGIIYRRPEDINTGLA